MAEQKTEETKPAVPKRVARPFIGPAGASTASRPLSRPSAPGERPRPAAFLPAPAAERPTLGTMPGGAPLPPAAVPQAPAPAVESSAIVPAAAAPAAPAFESLVNALPPDVTSVQGDDRPIVHGPTPATVEAVAGYVPEADPPGNVTLPSPVTSEMVAVDAFDAFDAVWGEPGASDGLDVTLDVNLDVTLDVTLDSSSPAAALDPVTLGTGIDAQQVWADEITGAPDATISISDHAESTEAHPDAPELVWPDAGPPDSEIPSWLADDAAVAAEPVVAASTDVDDVIVSVDADASIASPGSLVGNDEAAVDVPRLESPAIEEAYFEPSGFDASATVEDAGAPWPDPLLAEYAPYIPTPVSLPVIAPPVATIAGIDPMDAVETEPAYEAQALAHLVDVHAGSSPDERALATNVESMARPLDEERQLDEPEPPPANIAAPGVRVSAALERLAERVRSGEIDVSSVAAEAPDAAVLASVLAALLGGSTSR